MWKSKLPLPVWELVLVSCVLTASFTSSSSTTGVCFLCFFSVIKTENEFYYKKWINLNVLQKLQFQFNQGPKNTYIVTKDNLKGFKVTGRGNNSMSQDRDNKKFQ